MNDAGSSWQELRRGLRLARCRQEAFQLRKRILLKDARKRESTHAVPCAGTAAQNAEHTRAPSEMPCVLRLRLNTAAFAASALVLTRSRNRTRFCSLRTCDAAGGTTAASPSPPVVIDACFRLSFETRASMRARRFAIVDEVQVMLADGAFVGWRVHGSAECNRSAREPTSSCCRSARSFATQPPDQPPVIAVRRDALRNRAVWSYVERRDVDTHARAAPPIPRTLGVRCRRRLSWRSDPRRATLPEPHLDRLAACRADWSPAQARGEMR